MEALTRASIRECEYGRAARERETRLQHFEQSQQLAERAIALDERYPTAHFALFCTLGEQLRIDGENLTSLFGYRRMMRELERTLELDPDHLDALSAKGTFLIRLPTLLGGDTEKGEELLRWVIARAPASVNARLNLAKSYCARGMHGQAIDLASEALQLARTQRLPDFVIEIQDTLRSMRARQAR
ncbi:hypothetical protein YTPLAS18_01980 [Nitrospira sp.]|nr:hypothetical protein YTPLAS18_01980 [Nitrospira sp.]